MTTPKYVEQRNRVMLGNLPEDFLRVESPTHEVASASAQGLPQPVTAGQQNYAQVHDARQITICIVQAQLAKNYSLTKMDPYVRVRIGHSVFETHSDMSGGKFPNWNKTITSYLPNGIKAINIEIFDERTLTSDERIAHGEYVFTEDALQGKYVDTWVPLSGKQGEGKEGSINITVYIRSLPYWSPVMPTPTPLMVVPQAPIGVMPYFIPGQHNQWTPPSVKRGVCVAGPNVTVQYPVGQNVLQNHYTYPPEAQVQPYRPTETDIKQMQEMFPDFDQEIILSVLETCHGNKEQATSSLLSLSDK